MPDVPCRHDRSFPLVPERTALLVIDMQRDFIDPEGAAALAGADTAPLAAIVPAVARLLAAARAAGLLVVHTREGHRPDLSDLTDAKREQYAASGIPVGAPGPLGRRFVRGEDGNAIVAALAPAPGEAVIDKPGFSAFHHTDLHERLVARGIDRLILTGVTAQCCVHSTLRAAVDHGYRCLTAEDGIAAFEPALHAATLAMIASEGHLFGWIAGVDAIAAALAPGH